MTLDIDVAFDDCCKRCRRLDVEPYYVYNYDFGTQKRFRCKNYPICKDAKEKTINLICDKIYKYIKAETNPYGSPTMSYESGNKIMNYIQSLKNDKGDID